MEGIAPGYILQRMHLRGRIRKWKESGRQTFVEVGSGNGINSELLLSSGLSGIAFDLNPEACAKNERRNRVSVNRGKFSVLNQDFIDAEINRKVDIVFSSMVIEHLDQPAVDRYFEKCKAVLNPGGLIVSIVPANMKFWGIEDEIAGHYKRYEIGCFNTLSQTHNLTMVLQVGLTYPLSNMLLGFSNKLVARAESYKLKMDKQERTELSGNRSIKFKTEFSPFMKLILNEFTLSPFHLAQRLFKNNRNAMVIYCELQYGN